MLKVGEQKILKKNTFLYKGVFVFQNSPVIIKSMDKEKQELVVEYIDREGNRIQIEGIKPEELE